MTVQELGMIAGGIISLALAYIPPLADRYDNLDAKGKAQVMGVVLILSALGVFALSCSALYDFVPCTTDGAKELFGVLLAALVANQAVYQIAVRPFKQTNAMQA